jgi:hypothetical protein
MQRAVWKWVLEPALNEISMPRGARILTVQLQGDKPVVWALVDPNAPCEVRKLRAVATGIEWSCDAFHYIGTFQFNHAVPLVFHVFEELRDSNEIS